MNCRHSCLSERSCRVAVCTGTPGRRGLSEPLRLCLLCMQMSSPTHVLSYRRHSPFFLSDPPLCFLFDVLAVVFVLAEEPISARAKLLFLRGVVCLWRLPLLFASSAACLWRLPLLFASSAASSKCAWRGQGRGQEAMACAISPFLQKLTCHEAVCFESNTNLLRPSCGQPASSMS